MASEDIRKLERAIEGIITSTNLVSASFSLSNGDNVNTTITTSNETDSKILSSVDFTYYVDSVADANAIPYGSNVNMSEWIYIPPYNDWGKTDNINTKTIVYLKNVSAGTHTILVRAYVRTITNSLTNAGQTA